MIKFRTFFLSLFCVSLITLRPADTWQGFGGSRPRLVDAFINSIGVNTHLDAKTTSYADAGLVLASLKYVGFKYIRDDALEGGIPFDANRLKAIMDAGIKIDLDLGDGNSAGVPAAVKAVSSLEQLHADGVSSVEGYNEVDQPTWQVTFAGNTVDAADGYFQPVVDAQKSLYNSIRSDPNLTGVGVLNFSLGSPDKHSAEVGDVSSAADYNNVHAYAQRGSPPRQRIARVVDATTDTHGLPVIVTETGYSTIYPNSTEYHDRWHDTVDEQVQGAYLPDALLDNFSNNIFRTYVYELLDRRADPRNENIQAHFGIFRYDGSPKPAATTLSNLIHLLQHNNQFSNISQLQDVEYSLHVNGNEDNCPVYSLLFQKAPGLYAIVYWAEPRIWDSTNLKVLPAPNCGNVVFTFPAKFQRLTVFDPSTGRGALSTEADENSVSHAVVAHPIVVEVQF